MEELLGRHRKEQRDLQSQITQKKKSASKKTRKTVNDECARLEEELKARQNREVAEIQGPTSGQTEESQANENIQISQEALLDSINTETSLEKGTAALNISGDAISKDAAGEAEDASSTPQQRKPNRQKARLARRAAEQEAAAEVAAEEAANMPDMKQQERDRMIENFTQRGLQEKEIAANGHCMYSAIADQMRQLGLPLEMTANPKPALQSRETSSLEYKTVRNVAATYISNNSDEFLPFLEEPLSDYIHKIRDTGEWGGQLELTALAKAYNITIHVLQSEGRAEKIEAASDTARGEAWLAYYRHGFGLGEHYNSLRKTGAG